MIKIEQRRRQIWQKCLKNVAHMVVYLDDNAKHGKSDDGTISMPISGNSRFATYLSLPSIPVSLRHGLQPHLLQ